MPGPPDRAEGGPGHDGPRPPRGSAPRCQRGHPLVFASRFRLTYEAGDPPADPAALQRLQALGVELGAYTVWHCPTCGDIEVIFRALAP